MNLGIGASSMDNPFLPEEYHERRKCLYPPDWYDRFVLGSFTDFTDLIYKEFSESTHVWNEFKHWDIFGGEQNPPEDWPIIEGMDIGGGEEGDPWAIPIIAVAPNGMLFQFDEVYGSGLRIRPIAEEMFLKRGKHSLEGMAYDYAQRAAALELEEYGIFGQPAVKDVDAGLMKTAQYMHIDPRLTHPFNPRLNDASEEIHGSPRYFVSSRCTHTIQELSTYKWAKDRSGNAKNEPAHENSHCPSAIRYAIHTFRPEPAKITPPKIWENPALNELSRQFWRQEEQKPKERDGSLPLLRFARANKHMFQRPGVMNSDRRLRAN
jgi:hypothetical protein